MYIYITVGKQYKIYKIKFIKHLQKCCYSLRENTEFFWSLSSRVLTEYGDIRKSSYSVRIQENTYQKKFRIWKLFT